MNTKISHFQLFNLVHFTLGLSVRRILPWGGTLCCIHAVTVSFLKGVSSKQMCQILRILTFKLSNLQIAVRIEPSFALFLVRQLIILLEVLTSKLSLEEWHLADGIPFSYVCSSWGITLL